MYNPLSLKDQKGTKTAILQALRIHGSISRVLLSELTGFSRATISESIGNFIEYGWVVETEQQESTGGRPAVSLELAPNSCAILGADLDDQVWTIGAFDLVGNQLHISRAYVEHLSPEVTIRTLLSALEDFIRDLEISPIPLLGIGAPGLVHTEQGIIQSAADIGWQRVEIGNMISRALGWPTVVLNRNRARGLAECRYGAGRDHSQILYIGVGTGVAGGLFLNRQLYSGFMGGAGEIGHMTIDPNGPVCPCGNRGCLQVMTSGSSLVQEARRLIREGYESRLNSNIAFDLSLLRSKDICQAAIDGDAVALTVIEQAGTHLGIAMANLVNFMNPEAIILGGAIPRECPLYVDTAIKVMQQRAMGPLAAATTVKTALLTKTGGALGAANYALDRHLTYAMFASANRFHEASDHVL